MVEWTVMFTGIVETTANVQKMENGRLIIGRPTTFDDVKIGSSIAVAGVCLSIVKLDDQSMSFDIIHETLNRTNLGALKKGDSVNLERSMKTADRFDGHVVQGHVEGTGRVIESGKGTLRIELPEELQVHVVSKGSVAIDGVSLTVAGIDKNTCLIALIPHTLKETTLGKLKKNDLVNIETDILSRYSHSSPL